MRQHPVPGYRAQVGVEEGRLALVEVSYTSRRRGTRGPEIRVLLTPTKEVYVSMAAEHCAGKRRAPAIDGRTFVLVAEVSEVIARAFKKGLLHWFDSLGSLEALDKAGGQA